MFKCIELRTSALFLLSLLLGSCQNFNLPKSIADSNQVLDYQLQDSRYAVVVVQDGGISISQAKKMARVRAAEMTVESGNRFFVILSEEQTRVLKQEESGPDDRSFPQNMYQELIIEGDFGKNSQERRLGRMEESYPATRIVFDCYLERPSGNAIDACSLTPCN